MKKTMLRGAALAAAYAELKSKELGGQLWAFYEGRRIVIRGENLPVHPQHPTMKGRTWSLLGRLTPTHCREYLANEGCMGQSVAYTPAGC